MDEWQVGLRQMVELELPTGVCPMLVWYLRTGERVSDQLREAVTYYIMQNCARPVFAFLWDLPRGAEECMEVAGVTLIQADWVRPGFAVLARGGEQQIREEYQHWKKVKSEGREHVQNNGLALSKRS